MLLCWGPYGILAFYAAVENANLVSPKLRMVMDLNSFTFQKYSLKMTSNGNAKEEKNKKDHTSEG